MTFEEYDKMDSLIFKLETLIMVFDLILMLIGTFSLGVMFDELVAGTFFIIMLGVVIIHFIGSLILERELDNENKEYVKR